MPQTYTPEFRRKIVRLHEEEGRTYKSITAEYGVFVHEAAKRFHIFFRSSALRAIVKALLEIVNFDFLQLPKFQRSEVFFGGFITIHCRFPSAVGGKPQLIQRTPCNILLALRFPCKRGEIFYCLFFRLQPAFFYDDTLLFISLDPVAFCYCCDPKIPREYQE